MITSEAAETTKNNLLRLARKLPTSSMVFSRLGLLLRDINTELADIVKLVSVDSGLSSRVIRVSNSVMFGGDEPARTLEDAINRIGFRETHRVVGMAMTEQVFQNDLPVYGVTAEELWENSVVTALAMEKLAILTGDDEGMAYTVGLLRTVGKLVLDRLLEIEQPGLTCPESEAFDLPKWEKAWAPMSSNEVGAMILDDWKLPAIAGNAVRSILRAGSRRKLTTVSRPKAAFGKTSKASPPLRRSRPINSSRSKKRRLPPSRKSRRASSRSKAAGRRVRSCSASCLLRAEILFY
jgi:HD-like signal output (HDOD) protein